MVFFFRLLNSFNKKYFLSIFRHQAKIRGSPFWAHRCLETYFIASAFDDSVTTCGQHLRFLGVCKPITLCPWASFIKHQVQFYELQSFSCYRGFPPNISISTPSEHPPLPGSISRTTWPPWLPPIITLWALLTWSRWLRSWGCCRLISMSSQSAGLEVPVRDRRALCPKVTRGNLWKFW